MNNLDRTSEYMVLNYNASQIFVSTRDTTYAIPAGSAEAPVEWPMTLNEITYVNNTTNYFKVGLLRFEPEYEADIYDALRIRDWQDILTDADIDDIILNPTVEKLDRVIKLPTFVYFNRVYARYVFLKNKGRAISGSVERVMKLRAEEFQRGIINSKIQIGAVDNAMARQAETDSQIKALQEQVAALTALLASKQETPKPVELDESTMKAAHDPVVNAPEPAAQSVEKPAPKKTTKTTTKKGTPKQGA